MSKFSFGPKNFTFWLTSLIIQLQELGLKYQFFLIQLPCPTKIHIFTLIIKLLIGLDGDLEYSTDEDGWQDPDMPGPSNQPNNPFNITIADPNAAPTGIELCIAKDNYFIYIN